VLPGKCDKFSDSLSTKPGKASYLVRRGFLTLALEIGRLSGLAQALSNQQQAVNRCRRRLNHGTITTRENRPAARNAHHQQHGFVSTLGHIKPDVVEIAESIAYTARRYLN
jgi:hypothetical protein